MTASLAPTQLQRLIPALGGAVLCGILAPFIVDVPAGGTRVFLVLSLSLLLGLTIYFASRHFEGKAGKVSLIVLSAALLAGMLLRSSLLSHQTYDYIDFLQVWASQFRAEGWAAIGNNSSDYTMPYLYFIALITRFPISDLYLYKLGSIVFDCLLMLASLRLAAHFKLSPKRAAIMGALVFLTPTVWLNSAYWGQCDAIFAFFCAMCFVYALENRPRLSVLMAGIAFALKLQTVFFLPVLAVYWIAKKLRFQHLLLFPLPYIAAIVPAILSGCSPDYLLGVYVRQTKAYAFSLNWNSPSLFGLLNIPEESHALFSKIGIGLAFLFILALIALALYRRPYLTDHALLLFTLCFVIGIPWLLPSMHDRYFYLADIFVVAVCVVFPHRWALYPLQLFASYGGYHAYLFASWLTVFYGMAPHSIALLAALVSILCATAWETYFLSREIPPAAPKNIVSEERSL